METAYSEVNVVDNVYIHMGPTPAFESIWL